MIIKKYKGEFSISREDIADDLFQLPEDPDILFNLNKRGNFRRMLQYGGLMVRHRKSLSRKMVPSKHKKAKRLFKKYQRLYLRELDRSDCDFDSYIESRRQMKLEHIARVQESMQPIIERASRRIVEQVESSIWRSAFGNV